VLLSAQRGLGHQLRFEVTDTGPGIDEGLQSRLFSPFVQGDSSITRRVGGSGLGLSICRQLAELMQGSVGVVSVRGQGSCFWAEIPMPAGDAEDIDSGSSGYGNDVLMGARVLMVEDNSVNMMIAVAMLEQWGLDVGQATGGQQAIDAVHQAYASGRPFDLVLMDVQMPDMSGHEATAVIRLHFSEKDLPIIALTAAALVSERNEALAAGMNDFLTKPIDVQRLRHTLVRVLREKYDS
jgi:CheY-like chemotaxis protein